LTCFGRITSFTEVNPVGRVAAIGPEVGAARIRFAFVQFDDVIGGLIHRIRGKTRIGARVRVRFKPKARRKGSILDIECFEPV
jgi:uncharacterized OB-fold protein